MAIKTNLICAKQLPVSDINLFFISLVLSLFELVEIAHHVVVMFMCLQEVVQL